MSVTIIPDKIELKGWKELQRGIEGNQERIKKVREFEEYVSKNKHQFNMFGDLKTEYRNRKCGCGSKLKLKYCHGIKYHEIMKS
jgi:uncharacterized protein YchJ